MDARAVPEQAFEDLVESYEQPHRAYHRLDHVLDRLRVDNESRSADWPGRVLDAVVADEAANRRIQKLILTTSHDAPATSPDERLLVDIDLSILGRGSAEFLAFENQSQR